MLPNTHIEPLISNDTLRELSKGEPGWSTGDISPEMSSLLRMTVPDIAAELLTLRALHAATTHPQAQPSPGAGPRAAKAFASLPQSWQSRGRPVIELVCGLYPAGGEGDAAPAPKIAITALTRGQRGQVNADTIRVDSDTRLSSLRLEAYAAVEAKHGTPPENMDSLRIHFDAPEDAPLADLRGSLAISEVTTTRDLEVARRRYALENL